jgi:hypothetical protein
MPRAMLKRQTKANSTTIDAFLNEGRPMVGKQLSRRSSGVVDHVRDHLENNE